MRFTIFIAGLATACGGTPEPVAPAVPEAITFDCAHTGADTPLAATTPLATGQTWPTALTTDCAYLYWTHAGGVSRVLMGGGEVEPLFDAPEPAGLAVSPQHVYFAADSTLWRGAKDGGEAEPLAAHLDTPSAIALDAAHVYWLERGRIARLAHGGDDVEEVIGGLASPAALVREGIGLYWADAGAGESDGTVGMLNLSTDFVATLARAQPRPRDVTVRAGRIVFTNDGGRVVEVESDHRSLRSVASLQAGPREVAIEGTFAFWTNATDGTVMKGLLVDGCVESIAARQAEPFGVTIGRGNVYWTNRGDGTVMGAPR
jgi:hypothetical protein